MTWIELVQLVCGLVIIGFEATWIVSLRADRRSLLKGVGGVLDELTQARANAQEYQGAMFAKHGQIVDLTNLVRAHEEATKIYIRRLTEMEPALDDNA
jgi:hypothetical protein